MPQPALLPAMNRHTRPVLCIQISEATWKSLCLRVYSRLRLPCVTVCVYRIHFYIKSGRHATLSCMLASFGSAAIISGTAKALRAAFGRSYMHWLCCLSLCKPVRRLSLDRKSLLRSPSLWLAWQKQSCVSSTLALSTTSSWCPGPMRHRSSSMTLKVRCSYEA